MQCGVVREGWLLKPAGRAAEARRALPLWDGPPVAVCRFLSAQFATICTIVAGEVLEDNHYVLTFKQMSQQNTSSGLAVYAPSREGDGGCTRRSAHRAAQEIVFLPPPQGCIRTADNHRRRGDPMDPPAPALWNGWSSGWTVDGRGERSLVRFQEHTTSSVARIAAWDYSRRW